MKKYKHTTTFTYLGKVYKVRADTIEDLYMKKANKLRDLKENIVIYNSNTTLDQWADIAFDTYKKDTTGLYDMKKRYKKYVSPVIGSRPIGSVKAVQCQEILNGCSGMSFSHVEKLRQEMSFLFETAVDNQLIPFNPAKKLRLPENVKGSRRSITEHERAHLLACYEKDPAYLLFFIILKAGCRPEEAVNLIGRDIDHQKRLLHIRGTKTKNSDRYVPISDDLYAAIKNTRPFDPVAPNREGRKHTKSSYDRLCAHLRRDMNISMGCKVYRNALIPPLPLADDFVPYCLRHTYCTDLCKAKVDIRTAQRLMGHANISITANIYTHVDIDDIMKAGELLEAYYNS
ncbi:MAG: site-specific integrase [Lachnospiraceae bacterium]|nr:site-specific integrase [Lachnospiraceae bacterium]